MARIIAGRISARPGDASTGTSTNAAAENQEALVLLNSVTATSAAVVSSGSFASVATAYSAIKVFVNNLKTATVSVVGVRTSSDGSNFSATDGAYTKSGVILTATQSTETIDTSQSTDMIKITGIATTNMLATIVGAALQAEISLFNLNATATNHYSQIQADASWQGSAETCGSWSYGTRTAAIAVHAIQIANNGGGNFIDGQMNIYGVRKS